MIYLKLSGLQSINMIRLNSGGKGGVMIGGRGIDSNKSDKNKKVDGNISNKMAPPPPSPASFLGPGFMKRSSTFVTEGIGWRKKSSGSNGKDAKERQNLALKVRQKVAQMDDDDNNKAGTGGNDGRGRMSRLVGSVTGGLKSWSSSEDVRQSVVGAFSKTVSAIKQRPNRSAKLSHDSAISNGKLNNTRVYANGTPTKRNSVSAAPLREKNTARNHKSNRTSLPCDTNVQLKSIRPTNNNKNSRDFITNENRFNRDPVALRNNNNSQNFRPSSASSVTSTPITRVQQLRPNSEGKR